MPWLQSLAITPALLLLIGCAGPDGPRLAAAIAAEAETEATLIPAAPASGFNFPYLLRFPAAGAGAAPPFLLVEPNNSGHVSPKFAEHIRAAMALAEQGVGGDVARRLAVPFLMPIFPRTAELYTHSLGRATLLAADPQLRRVDMQLLAMIADARRRLDERGIEVNRRVLMTGFSASAMFTTRFAALHPKAVQALAVGGINGFAILPLDHLGATPLPYPLGVADFSSASGAPFDPVEWRKVAQYLFMGGEDDNDAVQFDDAYPPDERQVIYQYLGERMMPDRWDNLQRLYRRAGADAAFVTYGGVGHGTHGRMHADIANFLRQAALSQRR